MTGRERKTDRKRNIDRRIETEIKLAIKSKN
jgi:hypothetical protein